MRPRLAGIAAIAGALALGGACRKHEAPPRDAGRRVEAVEPNGAFLRCVTASEVEIGGLANGQQVRRLVESAFDREGEAFVERVEGRCLAMVVGEASLRGIVREYAERMRGWRSEDEDEDGIVRSARAWNAGTSLVTYDRFLGCVVPDLERVRDGQALYERLASACFKGDLAAFVARVRGRCVPLLEEKENAGGARAVQARQRRLRDPEGRHEALWKQCLELAEEQRRFRDGEALVAAVDALLAARPPD